MLAVAVAAGIFAVTFRMPETVVAPFEIVAAEGSDPLQAPIAGELVAVRVREGQRVDAGAELFRIRSDEIRNAQSRRLQLLEDQRALAERSRRLDEVHAGFHEGQTAVGPAKDGLGTGLCPFHHGGIEFDRDGGVGRVQRDPRDGVLRSRVLHRRLVEIPAIRGDGRGAGGFHPFQNHDVSGTE